jgi:hypothetical protein
MKGRHSTLITGVLLLLGSAIAAWAGDWPPALDSTNTTTQTKDGRTIEIERGKNYAWELSSDGCVFASGHLSPDAANLLTIPQAALTTQPQELSIRFVP